jgi:hypothetical protein
MRQKGMRQKGMGQTQSTINNPQSEKKTPCDNSLSIPVW